MPFAIAELKLQSEDMPLFPDLITNAVERVFWGKKPKKSLKMSVFKVSGLQPSYVITQLNNIKEVTMQFK